MLTVIDDNGDNIDNKGDYDYYGNNIDNDDDENNV